MCPSSPSAVTTTFSLLLILICSPPSPSFPSFPLTSSLFHLVNISPHDLKSLFPDHVLLFCVFFSAQYFSFIMVILRLSAFPLATCFLLKHHIHGRDETLPHRPECKFNIAFSLLSDVHNLSQYLLPWGMRICLFDKFSAQVDFAGLFFRHANGTRQFRTNKFILLPFFFFLLMINTRFFSALSHFRLI